MRKLSLLLLLCIILPLTLVSCGTEHDFVDYSYRINLKSDYAFVYYPESGQETYFGNEEQRIYPASTTKLLTILAALEILPADELITPGDEVYMVESGSSSAYIRPHHTLTLEMLAEGMLLPSGNDAAYAVAAACGYVLLDDSNAEYTDAVERFVEYMNEYATSIGCTGSHFTTPDGYADDEHYSTLHDMALISKLASENEIITKYAALESDDVVYASLHTNTWTNTNKMLDKDSKYYRKNIVGLKTGSLDDYYNLIALYDDGERRFIVGVFGSDTDDGRYKDVLNIIKYENLFK